MTIELGVIVNVILGSVLGMCIIHICLYIERKIKYWMWLRKIDKNPDLGPQINVVKTNHVSDIKPLVYPICPECKLHNEVQSTRRLDILFCNRCQKPFTVDLNKAFTIDEDF